ncbi:DarT ssDNA thymidine ADP-ribosyltransferase family protein [Sulfurimonas hydrogeniphila]|uniref:DarT ssDNA thymidine ADP-ribosyltransferase family protein n=1 Tax=Sulfurimonas hydrogeniphila TaxID=2509341 RepID=UPI00125FED37|nr:DarT ssDNA thymidine ADP-ribosyltransferase family protein [Sulfurimonas hydrogeniphila]
MNIQATLQNYGIKSIWHFTDLSNLESIKKHGVLSLRNIIHNRIDVACYGANELSHNLDISKGLDQFVHLSFIKEHPMQHVKTQNGDIPNPVWLKIDASVLFRNRSIFSDRIANKTGAKIYGDINDLSKYIDLDVLWSRTDWRDPQIQQRRKNAKYGEIMIQDKIDIKDIVGVYRG